MDPDSQSDIQESIERQRMQEEAINGNIEAKAEELMGRDTGKTFTAIEIAELPLQLPSNSMHCLANNDQKTFCFQQFLSIATNFASLSLADKLLKVPALVENVKNLFESVIKQIQDYDDMANELRNLIQCFIRMVIE